MARRLYRSDDRIIAGICGGIAEYFNWDPSLVRIFYILISIISAAFPGVLFYIIMWLIIPERY